jgi:hypothetical protein
VGPDVRLAVLLLPVLILPVAGEGAGTAAVREPAGQWCGLPAASPDAKAARVRDKPDADRSAEQSYGVPLHRPADQAVPIGRHGLRQRRAHAVTQVRLYGEFELCRPLLDGSSAANEPDRPALST